MPIEYIGPLSLEQMRILERFLADIERIANDMDAKVRIIKIGRKKDMPFVITEIDQLFADNFRRVDMMADSLTWQAYQLGTAQALFEFHDIIVWNLDPTAEHCDTCLEYAAIRYFTPETLPGIPGSAPTICDGGCKCYLTSPAGGTF